MPGERKASELPSGVYEHFGLNLGLVQLSGIKDIVTIPQPNGRFETYHKMELAINNKTQEAFANLDGQGWEKIGQLSEFFRPKEKLSDERRAFILASNFLSPLEEKDHLLRRGYSIKGIHKLEDLVVKSQPQEKAPKIQKATE